MELGVNYFSIEFREIVWNRPMCMHTPYVMHSAYKTSHKHTFKIMSGYIERIIGDKTPLKYIRIFTTSNTGKDCTIPGSFSYKVNKYLNKADT